MSSDYFLYFIMGFGLFCFWLFLVVFGCFWGLVFVCEKKVYRKIVRMCHKGKLYEDELYFCWVVVIYGGFDGS